MIAALGAQRQAADQGAANAVQLDAAAKQTRDLADRTSAQLKTDAKTRSAALALSCFLIPHCVPDVLHSVAAQLCGGSRPAEKKTGGPEDVKATAAEEARIEPERIAALGAQRQAPDQGAAKAVQLDAAAKQTRDFADRTSAQLKTDAKTRSAALALSCFLIPHCVPDVLHSVAAQLCGGGRPAEKKTGGPEDVKARAAEEARIEPERIAALDAQRQAADQGAAKAVQLDAAAKTRDLADRTSAQLKTDVKTRDLADRTSA